MKPKRTLAQLLHDAARRAETSKDYPTCPNCGAVLEGWKPDDVTGDSDSNQDPDNEGDGVDGADQDNDEFDNRTVTKARNLARDLAKASTTK